MLEALGGEEAVTNAIPYQGHIIQIDFDFRKHQLIISSSTTEQVKMDLHPMTVADFYRELIKKLTSIGVEVDIHARPNEMEPAIPFAENTVNKYYEPTAANAKNRYRFPTVEK